MVADFVANPVLREQMLAVDRQVRAQIEEIRATFEQGTDKGASVENMFRQVLRRYLPRRIEVGHGEIIDAAGSRSSETDVVIVSEDHPFTFTPDLPGLFFVEGVSAAGEVKSVLTTSGLEDALVKSQRFKRLRAQHRTAFVQGTPSDLERFHRCPPWFLVAFESQLGLPTVQEKVDQFMGDRHLSPEDIGDAVFLMDQGWVINFGDGKGELQFGVPGIAMVEGWAYQDSDLVLFDLLAWLSIVMPRIVRFEPVLVRYMFADSPQRGAL